MPSAISNPEEHPPILLVLTVAFLGWNLTYAHSLTPSGGLKQGLNLRCSAIGTGEPGNRVGGNLPSRQVQEPSTGEQVPPLLQLHTEEQLGP